MEGQFTYSSSRKYPQSTRVLLYLANTLLATTGVAFVAQARATGTDVDPSGWGVLGDAVLGDPLYVTGRHRVVARAAPSGADDRRAARHRDGR